MRTEEVAAWFRVTPHTIRRWVREGRLKVRTIRIGRGVLFSRKDIEAMGEREVPECLKLH